MESFFADTLNVAAFFLTKGQHKHWSPPGLHDKQRLLDSVLRQQNQAAGYSLSVERLSQSWNRVAPTSELPLGTRDSSSNFAPK